MGYFIKKQTEGGSEGLIISADPRPATAIEGLLRYNDTNKALEYYAGSTIGYVELAKTGNTIPVVDNFTGNGVLTDFTMSQSVSAAELILVFVDGVLQTAVDLNYTVAGTTLSFGAFAVPNGLSVIVIHNLASTDVATADIFVPAP